MAGTCLGLVDGDKKGIWFIVTVAADNMQGRESYVGVMQGSYQVTCAVMIWETG